MDFKTLKRNWYSLALKYHLSGFKQPKNSVKLGVCRSIAETRKHMGLVYLGCKDEFPEYAELILLFAVDCGWKGK